MALKNIIALASILIAAASCSMEDELTVNNTSGQIALGDQVAYMSFNVDAQKAVTKADETPADSSYFKGTELAAVTDCSLIIMDAVSGSVFKAYDKLKVTDGKIQFGSSTNLQLKLEKDAPEAYNVLIVANTAQTFSGVADYSAINAKVLGESDKNLNIMVSPLTPITLTGYETIADAQDNIVEIKANLSHLTAKIALCGFNVDFREGTLKTDVMITKVELLYVNTTSGLFAASPTLVPTTSLATNLKVWDGATNATTGFTAVGTSSFANQNANNDAIAMRLTMNYGSVEGKEVTFIINRPDSDIEGQEFNNATDHDYIKAGYIYQVIVNATFTGNLLDCSIKCYTRDWNYKFLPVKLEDVPTTPIPSN